VPPTTPLVKPLVCLVRQGRFDLKIAKFIWSASNKAQVLGKIFFGVLDIHNDASENDT
jgi:hypothetical protein